MKTRSRCTKPLTELIAYLDVQIAELRDTLARTQAELEEHKQAELFGWAIVHARRKARADAAVNRLVDATALYSAAVAQAGEPEERQRFVGAGNAAF